MTGRMVAVTAGAFALAMLGFAAVAKAKPGGPIPTGPDAEDCDDLEEQLQTRKNYRQALLGQRAALLAAINSNPGPGTDEELLAELAQLDGALVNVNGDIASIEAGLEECQ